MQVKTTFIVSRKGKWCALFELYNGHYFISSNGAFGQTETTFEEIAQPEAQKLIGATFRTNNK